MGRALFHITLAVVSVVIIDGGTVPACEVGLTLTKTAWCTLFAAGGLFLALVGADPAGGRRYQDAGVPVGDATCLVCCVPSRGALARTRITATLVVTHALLVMWAILYFLSGEHLLAYFLAHLLNLLNLLAAVQILQATLPLNALLFVPPLALGALCDASSIPCI